MLTKRTDLALEARELFEESVGETTALQECRHRNTAGGAARLLLWIF